MSDEYARFLAGKAQLADKAGFTPLWIPDFLFDFQRHLVEWAIRVGRGAIFAECGLGKSPMSLVWAENVRRHANKPVLLLTPLAVAQQFIREAEKFGIDAARSPDGSVAAGITITNYERLHRFNADDYAGVVCDESGILKSFDGVVRGQITTFMRKIRYRLLCSATPAPNDYVELGTSSEALGYLGFMDMLSKFFKNNRNNASLGRMGKYDGNPQWRFRGHAEKPFWRWVCSWARALRLPSDFGFDDARFALPPLEEREHVVAADVPRAGMLFSTPAIGLQEEREERRLTIRQRCEKVAELVSHGHPAVVWAHLNDEADLCEKMIGDGCVQVSGRDSDDEKEAKFEAFQGGSARVLVTKPVIGAWGLNWQHCAHMTTFGSHSFEQTYQSIRRLHRFGQKRTVVVDYILSSGESRVLANLQRKAEQVDRFFAELVANMRSQLDIDRVSLRFDTKQETPTWL